MGRVLVINKHSSFIDCLRFASLPSHLRVCFTPRHRGPALTDARHRPSYLGSVDCVRPRPLVCFTPNHRGPALTDTCQRPSYRGSWDKGHRHPRRCCQRTPSRGQVDCVQPLFAGMARPLPVLYLTAPSHALGHVVACRAYGFIRAIPELADNMAPTKYQEVSILVDSGSQQAPLCSTGDREARCLGQTQLICTPGGEPAAAYLRRGLV